MRQRARIQCRCLGILPLLREGINMACCDFCPYVDECEPEKNIPPTSPLLPCWWEYHHVEDWKRGVEKYKKQQAEIFEKRRKLQINYWRKVGVKI